MSAQDERGERVSRVSPWRERGAGLALLGGLHALFTTLTLIVARTVPGDAAGPTDLLGPWMGWFGLLQGIWLLPALLTAALLQRRHLAEGIGLGGPPLGLAHPRHPTVASDVADRSHVELPEREIAEVGVVRRIGMRRQEGGTSAAPVPLDARAGTEYRDTPVGEGIYGAALGDQQRRARVPLQIFRVLGKSADEEDRGSVLKGHGHERAVGVAGRLQREGTERPGRDLGDECSRALRVGRRRGIDVVERLRRVARRPGVCILAHGSS